MTIQLDDWDAEWDAMSHTPHEYREEIRQLRQRCCEYWVEIDRLREEKRELLQQLRQEKTA